MKFRTTILLALSITAISCGQSKRQEKGVFPYKVTKESSNRQLSEAMKRSFTNYPAPRPQDNELYTQFKYTPLEGLNYNGDDGTISRRDPSKVIFENGKYYVWYTHRQTSVPPQGPDKCNDTIPSTDWDLCEIWYATSEDGFHWTEQGVAIPRPPKPNVGWRSVSTADILKWKGKYYLYYQGFLYPSLTRGGDYCPVTASYADSPDGPWTPTNKIIIPNGKKGEWDQNAIHDPYPLVHDGKIFLYYKSPFNVPNKWVAAGLAIANDPLGPFAKCPLNPVLNSGHETTLFPFKEGVAAMLIKDGTEHFTVQYAKDWVNFKIASIVELMPTASGPFVPDAFTDTKNGRGITWGLCHFVNAGTRESQHSILARFDCDLSLDVNDQNMKGTGTFLSPDVYFRMGLNSQEKKRIEEATQYLKH